jgi:hypothetical protein
MCTWRKNVRYFVVNLDVHKRLKHTLVLFSCILAGSTSAQCAYTCSSYIASPYTFSMQPAAGTTLSLLDDEVSTTVPLNFVFDYYCTSYNQVRIGSNGFITFDFGSINHANTPYAQALPNPTSPNAVIAWNWNDLDPSTLTGSGTITYTTVGTSPNQKFIVTYSAVPLWTTSAPPPSNLLNTGQIILHESTNLIEVQIKDATNNGWLTHTEGIEDQTGQNGVAITNPPRNLALWQATNSAHLFSPFSVAATVQASGPTTLCAGTTAVYSATANPPPLSYNWFLPNGWTGTGTSSTIAITAGASGNVSVSANYTCGACPPAVMPITVTAPPVVNVSSASPTILCSGGQATITAAGAVTYSLQPGGATGGQTFTTAVNAPTTFTLSGTNPQGCVSKNNATVFINTRPSPTITVNSGSICLGKSFLLQPAGAFSYNFPNANPQVTPQTAGITGYTIAGTGTNGCVSAPVVSQVTVQPLPSLTVTSTRTLYCKGETIDLSAAGAFAYLWQHNSDSGPVTMAQATAMKHYFVDGVDVHGCKSTGSVKVEVSSCVEISEAPDQTVAVFPNPFSGETELITPLPAKITLSDAKGVLRLHGNFENGTVMIGAALEPGVYFLEVRCVAGTFRKLLIKQ